MNAALTSSESKLATLLLEVRGTAMFERVRLYVRKMTGGRMLAEYLRDDGVPVKERAILATTMIDILLTKDYSRLPELPEIAPVKVAAGAENEPVVVSVEVSEDEPDDPPMDAETIRELVRAEVRSQLAGVLETIARVLKETK